MRKIFVYLLIAVFCMTSVFAEYVTILEKGECEKADRLYGTLRDTMYIVTWHSGENYEKVLGIYETLVLTGPLYFTTTNYNIPLNGKTLTEFRAAISKYFEWERIAVQNHAIIDKDIAEITIPRIIWTEGKDSFLVNELKITVNFKSATDTKHYMTIKTNTPFAINSQVKKRFEMETLYFTKENARELMESISDDRIAEAKSILQKRKDIDSLFK